MNERYKDLAHQATEWCHEHAKGPPVAWEWEQKFAELIIRDCTQALQTEMYRLDSIPGREVSAQTMETAAELIKKRFGVK